MHKQTNKISCIEREKKGANERTVFDNSMVEKFFVTGFSLSLHSMLSSIFFDCGATGQRWNTWKSVNPFDASTWWLASIHSHAFTSNCKPGIIRFYFNWNICFNISIHTAASKEKRNIHEKKNKQALYTKMSRLNAMMMMMMRVFNGLIAQCSNVFSFEI